MTTLAAHGPEILERPTHLGEDSFVTGTAIKRTTARPKIPLAIPVAGLNRPIEVCVASTRSEWEQAFRLVAANYQARGYEPTDAGSLRFTPFHALPGTMVFVAKHHDEVVATLSLVPDNTLLGLPMECIYGQEIRELRVAGRRLVEVTSLADQDLSMREFMVVFVALMRLQAQYGLDHGADTWVITVNPRHRNFYRKILGFVSIGACRAYPTVQNNPAEAYLLDKPTLKTTAPTMFDQMFAEWLPRVALESCPMPAHLVRHFAGHSSLTDCQTIDEVLRYVQEWGSPMRW